MAASPYPTLGDIAGLGGLDANVPLRVCIVTPDLLGPVKNGGIGTACGYLAEALVTAGHDTTVLFCQTGAEELDPDWISAYGRKGVKAVNAAAWQREQGQWEIFPNLRHLAMARIVYGWLRKQDDFDLILFMDWQAPGFYAIHAKASGVAFEKTVLAVVIHSPSYWHNIHNAAVAANPIEAVLWHMERTAIAMADAVISPSSYMLRWTSERLCRLPAHAYVQPNLLEWPDNVTHESNAAINEIVFFGRLEFRKGLEQFCSALDNLARRNQLPPKITFLGKCAWLGDDHSAFYIARRSQKWPGVKLRLETQLGHHEAVSYLCGPGRLAVMPSTADNSPYTVYECIMAHVPFLARDVGGISEFMRPQFKDLLFDDNPSELADKIALAVGNPPRRASLAFDVEANKEAWLQGLPKLTGLIQARPPLGRMDACRNEPLISVIVTHYNRPKLLRQALESLYKQDYDNFEVIVADDGSDDPEAIACLEELKPVFASRGWRILRLANGFPPAARNRGVEAARGDFVLFLDDDNVADPSLISTCMKAARRMGRGYAPMMFQVFEGSGAPTAENVAEIFLPTGNALAYGTLANTLCDTTTLIHKDSFWRVGGFREDYGIGHEDFELYLRLALAGEPCVIIPEILFYYRRDPRKSSVQLNTNAAQNRMRSLRPFLENLPPALAELALMTHSMGQLLGMFPDSRAEQFLDLALNHREDPGAPENIMQAAAALTSQGHGELADQLLESLPRQDDAARGGLIRSRAVAAARKNDLKTVRSCLKEFGRLRLPETALAPLCRDILGALRQCDASFRRELLVKIQNIKVKDALAYIILSEDEAASGHMDKAARQFIEALRQAETAYVTARPDVGESIANGAFVCALQHFALHGITDKMPWPERAAFSLALKRHPELIPLITRLHGVAWKYESEALATQLISALISGYDQG